MVTGSVLKNSDLVGDGEASEMETVLQTLTVDGDSGESSRMLKNKTLHQVGSGFI